MSAQNLSGQQFRQDALWGESGAWKAADRQVRENMARRVTGAADDPDFVEHMGRSNATRADMLALEHINPTVRQGLYRSGGGSYSQIDNYVEYNPSYLDSDTRHTLYHELGHAMHVGGQRYGGAKTSSPLNPDPVQEGVADGVAERMSKGGSGGSWTYRDSHEYTADATVTAEQAKKFSPGVVSWKKEHFDITDGGTQWGNEGRAAYEASRALAKSGQMPAAPHWSYRSGTMTQLARTPGYSETVSAEHQYDLEPALKRDQAALSGTPNQLKLF